MHRKKLILAAVSLLLAGALATAASFAWLGKSQEASGIYTVLSDFEVAGKLSFGDKEYAGKDVLVPVSFTPADDNYIGKMKYSITYTGASPAYLRVRILEQWLNPKTNEILSAGYLNYNITGIAASALPAPKPSTLPAAGTGTQVLAETGTWVDYRAKDYCYYYSVPVQPKDIPVTKAGETVSAVGDGAVTLTLIDQLAPGADNAALTAGIDPTTTTLSLLIQVEAVQPNRIREFWNIEAIPQPQK
ncbi:MAG: hypothetical protein RR403_01165 [Pseudoflavonifractor sp.]